MTRIQINVPEGINYLGDWKEFSLPLGKSILNKALTGCGLTESCLRNDVPVILCSPRKFLLDNKYEQHKATDGKNFHLHLVINQGEKSLDIDKELSSDDKKAAMKELENMTKEDKISDVERQQQEDSAISIIMDLKCKVVAYLGRAQEERFTPKILVTYDSLKYVLECIPESLLKTFWVVVDEFQNIFMDARFKASVEMNFISYLQGCPNVTYVSATPMMEKYLDRLPEFADLPYYELIWPEEKIRKPYIKCVRTWTVQKCIEDAISDYLSSRFPYKVLPDGTIVYSKELVIYFNSVSAITRVVKKCGLTMANTNIICSDTASNIKKLQGVKMDIGTAPKKGEPHKMFTLCTRTVYAGADFYSTCASTIIASDCNLNTMSVDIALDLPQIMGRQRLPENLFRNEAVLYYRALNQDSCISKENFEKLVNEKLQATKEDIENYESVKNKKRFLRSTRILIKLLNYSDSYVGVDEKTKNLKMNSLVMIAEERAFEIKTSSYIDDISLFNDLCQNGFVQSPSRLGIEQDFMAFLDTFRGISDFRWKMKALCDYISFNPDVDLSGVLELGEYYRYVILLGPNKIKALDYRRGNLDNAANEILSKDGILEKLQGHFTDGTEYTLKEIKSTLQSIYNELGIKKTAKATDLENYYNLVSFNKRIGGKKVAGYKIIGKK
jgi:hypothetical protein